ncbi:phosphoglycerate mutase family protein [Rutstroemia sp. NJR-2017a BVV2]|nr:phosphoglycerate mutase family protein [Rutstroemia sp. NJR-2017a BVV2]
MLLLGSMERSSEINDTSTKTAATMPNSLVAAAPNASGTENLLASSHLTEDTLVKHKAQEVIQPSIPSTSPRLNEGSQTSSVSDESQEDEDADTSIYHDAAESIRSPASVQTAFLVDPTYSEPAQSIRSSSSVQTAIWVGPTYPSTTESIRSSSSVQTAFQVGLTYSNAVELARSCSLPQRAASMSPESPTAECSSDDNSEVISSDGNSSLVSLAGSKHLDRQVYDVSARTPRENSTISSTHSVAASSLELNVEKATSEFDVQVATVESGNASPMQMGSAEQGRRSRRTVHNDASLSESVTPARSNHDQKDASPRKMSICKRIKAFFKPPKQPKIFFHLIRHGEAYHNLGHEHGLNRSSFALPDPSLTQLGIQQALSLKQHISPIHPVPTLILISPLLRAVETALLVYPPASCKPKPQYIAYDDLRECGNHPCNKRAELGGLRKRYAGRGLDLRALSEEAPVIASEDIWSRAGKVKGEFGMIAEMLKRGGGFWKGVFLREALQAGKDKDIHVVVVSHGSFLKRLLGIPPGPESRCQFMPTELRSCELNAEGGLVETRESVQLRLARSIIAKL